MLRYLCVVAMATQLRMTEGSLTPTVNLTSCLQETVTVRISDTWDGGLVYMRADYSAFNVQLTSGGPLTYTCSFEDCNINWDERFTVVVQKRPHIQTKHDVFIWFVCLNDMGAISPAAFDSLADSVGNLTRVTFRPEGVIRLSVDGIPIGGGDDVKLGSVVEMFINITNNNERMFDISVKTCAASLIPLYVDKCPVDTEIFGSFVKTAPGTATNTFQMFRPTTTENSIEVIFTCVVEVCMDACDDIVCNTTTTGRRKRQASDRRSRTDESSRRDNMFLGMMINVVDEPEQPVIVDKDQFCFNLWVAIVFSACCTVIVAIQIYFAVNFRRKLIQKQQQGIRKSTTEIGSSRQSPPFFVCKVSSDSNIIT